MWIQNNTSHSKQHDKYKKFPSKKKIIFGKILLPPLFGITAIISLMTGCSRFGCTEGWPDAMLPVAIIVGLVMSVLFWFYTRKYYKNEVENYKKDRNVGKRYICEDCQEIYICNDPCRKCQQKVKLFENYDWVDTPK